MASYQQSPQDEGYSEDPLTMIQPSGDVGQRRFLDGDVPLWLSSMPVADRSRLAMNIINGLPTSAVSDIVDALRPRLFIDFFNHLPAEVCLKVLGYLDPVSLIRTAQASRGWMSLSMDWKLWQQLYYLEGWRTIPSVLQQFERQLNMRPLLTARTRPSTDGEDEHAHKKRATPKSMSAALRKDDDSEMQDVDTISQSKQESLFGSPTSQSINKTGRFIDTPGADENLRPSMKPSPASLRHRTIPPQEISNRRDSNLSIKSQGQLSLSFLSSLVVLDREENKQRLNWQYLYTQRRRLEANWESEKYVNFQLPHPDYPQEAHTECIYTIQQSGKYLVSGSRDKTLRVWDLETRRLIRQPLEGHSGSVLCLQFDPDPEEDLIVSGSSDSTVMLWKFSTGQLIQVLKKAHRESVLNVRFDHRILVTCSKDKTIKIFNRRPMHAGDLGYPDMPQVLRPVPTVLNNYGFSPSPFAELPVKPPYSMIGCLDGHSAAVNAVQIYNNEIVSASGDRVVKVWDWPLQTCTRTLVGHQKGIACVQYDGRRIVSGSSDNEVKVFDKDTGLEVASLRAHTSLVRTVQAGFGDLPYSAEEDQANARDIDDEYFRAVDSGVVPRSLSKGRPRNAGSRRPEDIMAYGAKLPPGGGGGRYGRIVSGSYDETVIIWRRDKEGVWKAQHTLRQEDAAVAAAREAGDHRPPDSDDGSDEEALAGDMQLIPGSQAFYHHLIESVVPQGPNALRQAITTHPHLIQYPHLQAAISAEPFQVVRNQLRSIVAQALARQQILLAQQLLAHNGTPDAHGQTPAAPSSQPQASTGAGSANPPTAAATPGPAVAGGPIPGPIPGPHPAVNHGPPQLHPHLVPASMARVFKLQFDARRIICCSQTPIIVGWDFANGDEKIIEASRFFAPVE